MWHTSGALFGASAIVVGVRLGSSAAMGLGLGLVDSDLALKRC